MKRFFITVVTLLFLVTAVLQLTALAAPEQDETDDARGRTETVNTGETSDRAVTQPPRHTQGQESTGENTGDSGEPELKEGEFVKIRDGITLRLPEPDAQGNYCWTFESNDKTTGDYTSRIFMLKLDSRNNEGAYILFYFPVNDESGTEGPQKQVTLKRVENLDDDAFLVKLMMGSDVIFTVPEKYLEGYVAPPTAEPVVTTPLPEEPAATVIEAEAKPVVEPTPEPETAPAPKQNNIRALVGLGAISLAVLISVVANVFTAFKMKRQ